ncbi:MAG: hypothetical protein P1U34_05230 [Coxiellaceae bacterium]|nr:hypothetical protein [Coxiellaceae bacterium]
MKTIKTLTRIFPAIVLTSLASFGVAYAAGFPPPAPNYVHAYVNNNTNQPLTIASTASHGTYLQSNPTSAPVGGQVKIIDDGSTYYPAAFTTHIGVKGPGQCIASISLMGGAITQAGDGSDGFTCTTQGDHIVLTTKA